MITPYDFNQLDLTFNFLLVAVFRENPVKPRDPGIAKLAVLYIFR
jgi:hypothetical protein